MTDEQKIAFIIAQAACLNAEVAGMVAENTYREMRGETIAFGEGAFVAVVRASGCEHNAVIPLCQEPG